MSTNERPGSFESFDLDLLKIEHKSPRQNVREMLETILSDRTTTKEDLADILLTAVELDVGIAIRDFYDAAY